jgi:dihydroneopterin aldolase
VVYDSTLKTVKIVTDSGSFDLPEAAAKPIREKIMARIRDVPAS